jgi:hypothetical protein
MKCRRRTSTYEVGIALYPTSPLEGVEALAAAAGQPVQAWLPGSGMAQSTIDTGGNGPNARSLPVHARPAACASSTRGAGGPGCDGEVCACTRVFEVGACWLEKTVDYALHQTTISQNVDLTTIRTNTAR